jgi:two-component system, OmpR family, manganese sensing response regulator
MPSVKQVLCVDESEEHCEIISHLLNQSVGSRFVVKSVTNPHEAVELIEKHSFDLFILESRLPGGISGVELCKIIRSKDDKTPILFFSGMARPIDRSLALAAGANDYLVKPVGLDAMPETVKRLLKKKPANN